MWTGIGTIRRWTTCNRSAQSWLDVAGKAPIELQLLARHARVRFSSTPELNRRRPLSIPLTGAVQFVLLARIAPHGRRNRYRFGVAVSRQTVAERARHRRHGAFIVPHPTDNHGGLACRNRPVVHNRLPPSTAEQLVGPDGLRDPRL